MKKTSSRLTPSNETSVLPLLLGLFIASGFSSLIYELIWIRRLALVFGSTTLAISTVLAAFIGGLALGSLFFGRMADAHPHKFITSFALLELGVGAWGLVFPIVLGLVGDVFLLLPWWAHTDSAFPFFQFFFIAPLIVVPTFLMGGTLPFLVAGAVRGHSTLATSIGQLYAANTLGACLGALGATFYFIPAFGLRGSEMLAAAMNLCITAIVLLKASSLRSDSPQKSDSTTPLNQPKSSNIRIWVFCAALTCLGFSSMSLQLLWSRLFAMVFGSSVYVFGVVLVLFLLGLAIGSWLTQRFKHRLCTPTHMAQAAIALGGVCILGYLVTSHLPDLFIRIFPFARQSFLSTTLTHFFLMGVWVLPTATLFGILFPLATTISNDYFAGAGRAVSQITLWNTVGIVVGSFITGFVLIPTLGLRATLCIATISVISSVFLIIGSDKTFPDLRSWLISSGFAMLLAIGMFLLVPWNTPMLLSGVGFFAPTYQDREGLHQATHSMQVPYYKDGISTTISVTELNGLRFYCSNGKTDASTEAGDVANQMLLGLIPMALHPAPRDVFMVGLGTGMSAAAVCRFPIESLDIADLEPYSSEAVRFFQKENRKVIDDPRVRVTHVDARQMLAAQEKSYDVIISDPSDVWVSGVGNLLTKEFYTLAASRLHESGVMVQWFHLHTLDETSVRRIVATFRSVFPRTEVWRPNYGDLILIGTKDPQPWNYSRLKRRILSVPGVKEDLLLAGMHSPLSLFAALVLQGDDLNRWLGPDQALNFDEQPSIEFQAPRLLYDNHSLRIDTGMRAEQSSYLPVMMNFDPDKDFTAEEYYLLGYAYGWLKRPDFALAAMRDSLKLEGNHALRSLGYGLQLQLAGRAEEAIKEIATAFELDNTDPKIVETYVQFLEARAERGQAEKILHIALNKAPESFSLNQIYIGFLVRQNKTSEAVKWANDRVRVYPADPMMVLLQGQALERAGSYTQALNSYRDAAASQPENQTIREHLSRLSEKLGL